MYSRSWLRLLGSAGFLQDVRVASFNTGSGSFFAAQTLATTIYSGMPFEVHSLISPAEKDRALDDAIARVRVRQEVPIWAIDGGHTYSVGPELLDIADVRYFSDPTASLSRDEHQLSWWKLESTGSGQELRVFPALQASQQLVIDAVLGVSLGAGDLATVNLPNDDWVLWGAAARCLWMLEQRSPGQEAGRYRERRLEAAREFTRLALRFQPRFGRPIQLAEVW